MVVGQIEAKMLLDRSNFTQGIKLTQSETSLLIPNLQAAAKAEGEVAGGATKAGGAASFLSGQFNQLAVMAMSYFGAQMLVNTAIRGFMDRAGDVTAINRDIVTMERLGISTAGAREEMEKTGSEFIRMGQRENAAYSSYQAMLQATGDVNKATKLLNESLAFAVMWDEDVQTVSAAVAKAYQHQYRQLDMLLKAHGFAAQNAATFAEKEALLKTAGEGANSVISDQQQAVFALRAEWKRFLDDLSDSTPVMNFIGNLKDLLEFWRQWQTREETAWDAEKASGKVHAARVAQRWDIGRMPAVEVTAKAPLTAEEQAAADEAAANRRAAAQEEVTKKLKGLLMDEFDFRRWTEMKWFADEVNLYGNLTGLADAHKAALAKIDEDQTESHRKAIQQWIDDEEKKAEKQAREAKQYDQEMTTQWEKDHRVQMQLLDGTGQQFKSLFVDLVTEGKFSIEDFGKSFLRMLAEIAADEAWNGIRALMQQLWGLGSWRAGGATGGGAMYEGGWEGGGGGEGGGVNVAGGGRGGGYLPPMLPPTITRPQPTIVNHITVQGDVTRFAEFSENVVGTGLTRMRKLGR